MTTAERIATALERIADRLELLTLENSAPEPASLCPHPEASRLEIPGTAGWICELCQHQS